MALGRSGVPALQRLAAQFDTILKSGGDLATGNPALRNVLGAWVHEAVVALEGFGVPRTVAFNAIANAINSGTTPNFNRELQRNPRVQPFTVATQQPGGIDAFLSNMRNVFNVAPKVGAATGAVAGTLAALPTFQPELIAAGAVEGYEMGRQIQDFGNKGLDAFTRLLSIGQGGGSGVPPMGPQGGSLPPPAPLTVPTLQTCTTCGYVDPNDANLLRGQQGELENSIKVEQQQNLLKQVGQQQHQIDDLRQQESQPLDSRDIPRELAQKQQLLDSINQELAGGQPQPNPQTQNPTDGSSGVPTLNYQPVPIGPTSPSSGGQPEMFMQKPPTENPPPGAPGQVKFCVVCTSQSESLKFLNGEPSECSVVS